MTPYGTPYTPASFGLDDQGFFLAVLRACPAGSRLYLEGDEDELWVEHLRPWGHRENAGEYAADYYLVDAAFVEAVSKLLEEQPAQLDYLHHLFVNAPDGKCLLASVDNFSILTQLAEDIREQLGVSRQDWDRQVRPKAAWQERLNAWLLMPLVAVMYVPLMIWYKTEFWLKSRTRLRGSVESAWENCATYWKECGFLQLPDSHGASSLFDYRLALALGRTYRGHADFFLQQLENPDPLLAGYAFFALTAARPEMVRSDIPGEVLHRHEKVRTLWADMSQPEALADLIQKYFSWQESRVA